MNFPNWIKRFALWYVWFSFLLIGCDSEPQAARKLYQVEEAQSDIRAVAFSPDNQAFAFITVDNQVQLRNLSKNEILQTFSYNEIDQLASLTFSNDSTQLAVSTETLVDVWDIEKNQLLKSFLVDDLFQGGGTLAFSPDGSHLALNAGDTLRIWDIQNDEIVTDVEVLHYAYYPGNIAFSPRGNLIAIFTGVLQIWSLESEELVAYIPYEYGSDSFSFTTDGMELVSTKRNEVFRWRMPHGELIDNFTIKGDICKCWGSSLKERPPQALHFSPIELVYQTALSFHHPGTSLPFGLTAANGRHSNGAICLQLVTTA